MRSRALLYYAITFKEKKIILVMTNQNDVDFVPLENNTVKKKNERTQKESNLIAYNFLIP